MGKGPLDALIRDDVARVDPYRLRVQQHPRNAGDFLYAHPKLRSELHRALRSLGERATVAGLVEWFPISQVVFFLVRKDWQLLFLGDLAGERVKAELFAPILPDLLSIDAVRERLGRIDTVVLNPAAESVTATSTWATVKSMTKHNCCKRGDAQDSVCDRVRSVAEEAPAWAKLITEHGATEYLKWQFPEYAYQDRHKPDPSTNLLQHQQQTLVAARSSLLARNPGLGCFLKSEDEIRRIAAPFVE
jgi:hypothetical protein